MIRNILWELIFKQFLGGRIFYFPKYIPERLKSFYKSAPIPAIDILGIELDCSSSKFNTPFESDLCRFEDINNIEYKNICNNVFLMPVNYQRKQWEWIYIYYQLLKSEVISPGKKGLGFGVGKEPLAAIFASRGCQILATDAPTENSSGWINTDQHASNINSLVQQNILNIDEFRNLCKFKFLDMNQHYLIPEGYDFHWSSCVIEHLGGLSNIKSFLIESGKKLNPDGIAVHTTEFNLTSNENTYSEVDCYVFRRVDIDLLDKELKMNGLNMKKIIFNVGSHPYNYHIDISSTKASTSDLHLRNLIGDFACTSMGIVIHKNKNARNAKNV